MNATLFPYSLVLLARERGAIGVFYRIERNVALPMPHSFTDIIQACPDLEIMNIIARRKIRTLEQKMSIMYKWMKRAEIIADNATWTHGSQSPEYNKASDRLADIAEKLWAMVPVGTVNVPLGCVKVA